ncbi:hypothetical protein D7004_06875 [Pedobacter jejuensis]|uniref:Uncharacterized protein n=1 Tax=Pedobacter jejuensis TaxID=1268550 RepID=A0A3N0BXN3_9SPHI|nr:hypothetical protein D7004_06875 [Pedobacter jejuensis]
MLTGSKLGKGKICITSVIFRHGDTESKEEKLVSVIICVSVAIILYRYVFCHRNNESTEEEFGFRENLRFCGNSSYYFFTPESKITSSVIIGVSVAFFILFLYHKSKKLRF